MSAELIIQFNQPDKKSLAGDPPTFSVRCPATGGEWSGGTFNNPLDDKDLAEVRWYLEEYHTWPFGPFRDRARAIEALLEQWGRELFDALFADPKAMRVYDGFINLDGAAQGRLLTLVTNRGELARLPWELLAESSGPLFSKRPPVSIRRQVQLEHAPRVRPFQLPLRLLFLAPRPQGAGFLDPRSEARAVLEAAQQVGGAVQVDFLRPPTLQALDAALRRAEREGRPYSLVHFDGHGVYAAETGLGYLLFEHPDVAPHLVDANTLGTLLNECGVPLALLSACQSAAGDAEKSFSSVATRLLQAGVGGVISMSHSVLSAAAQRFAAAFYQALVEGCRIGAAVDEARRALLLDPRRGAMAPSAETREEWLTLQDWFLPVFYQQRDDAAPFAGAQAGAFPPPPEPPAALYDPSLPGGLPPEPAHAFHGRASELLELERRFARHPLLVLRGFGGQGKTALAAEAARWLHRTGRFPGGAAFISFERGGGAALALSWVRQALGLGDHASSGEVRQALQHKPALLIFDNFESVLEHGDAGLPAAELRELLDLAWSWVAPSPGRSLDPLGPRLLITTRDTNFNHPRFNASQDCAYLELGGLQGGEALELARAVLDDRGIDPNRIPPAALQELMRLLGGHPLSLCLVLPHLDKLEPGQIAGEFERLLPGFSQGAGVERSDSLLASLDFSLRRLGEAARQALPALGVFAGLAMEDDLLEVTQLDPELWGGIRQELLDAGLAREETLPGIRHPYLHFHPTLPPYLLAQLAAGGRAELEERFWGRYYALANYLYRQDQTNPHFARLLAQRDLPNLRRALALLFTQAEAALDAAQPGAAGLLDAAADFTESLSRFLEIFALRGERRRLAGRLESLLQRGAAPGGGLSRAGYLAAANHIDALVAAGQAAAAEAQARELLAEIPPPPAGGDDPWAFERLTTLLRLGRSLRLQGRSQAALPVLRSAVQGLEALAGQLTAAGQADAAANARRGAGAAQADLADALVQLGRYAEAREAYLAALTIDRELDNKRGEAVGLAQLGGLALEQRDYPEARRRHQEARQAFERLGEPGMLAAAWHQLGRVAEEEKDWAEAERCYRQSLQIEEETGNLAYAASTANQLGNVCQFSGRLVEAETWFRRALDIAEQLENQMSIAIRCNNLASLLLDALKLPAPARPPGWAGRDLAAEAQAFALRAAKIREGLGDPSQPVWTTYSILSELAGLCGQPQAGRTWRLKEQAAFAAFAGAEAQVPADVWSFARLALRAAQGDAAARQAAAAQLPDSEQAGWMFSQPLSRLWAGERDPDALCADLDRNSALVVRRILQALSGERPLPQPEVKLPPFADAIAQLVAQSCQGDQDAHRQLEAAFPQLEAGNWQIVDAIRRMWDGERDPQVLTQGIDANSAAVVKHILAVLGGEAAGPDEQGAADPENITQVQLPEWAGRLAQALRDACQGDQPARQAVEQAMQQMAQTEDWRSLSPVLQRILDGERDVAALAAGLDEVPAAVVGHILAVLAGEAAASQPPAEQQGISLDQVLQLVEAGCRGDRQAGAQAYELATKGLQARDAPPELRSLGRALQYILEGRRGEQLLNDLPEQLKPPLRELLRRLGERPN
jgi:tetratricopeptide (TPR) repeat protein